MPFQLNQEIYVSKKVMYFDLLIKIWVKLTDAFKTSLKRAIQKAVEAAGDLIGNKVTDKIIRLSKAAPQNNLETNEEMLREKHISPELRQKIIDDLRSKED